MTTAPPDPDAYPEHWFPAVTKAKKERERRESIRQLEEMPTEQLKQALLEAQKITQEGTGGQAS